MNELKGNLGDYNFDITQQIYHDEITLELQTNGMCTLSPPHMFS